jgi:hypothetical protein
MARPSPAAAALCLAVLCGGLFLPCCGWEGVTCNPRTGRVTGLDLTMLSNIYDYGSSLLNATIFLPLQELRNLSLRNLGIQGCVPGAGNSLSPFFFVSREKDPLPARHGTMSAGEKSILLV